MGTVSHHQAQARRFLSLARADHDAGDYRRAAHALARAASHAATAGLVHQNLIRGPTRRRLTNCLFMLAAAGQIPFGAVKTFRRVYDLPAELAAAADLGAAMRLARHAHRRVSALLRALERAVAGRPQPAVRRRFTDFLNAPPPRPVPASIRDILALPNFKAIAAAHGLTDSPLLRRPDPHDMYRRGLTPLPCTCHPEPAALSEPDGDLPISPLWQAALKQTFKTKIPEALPYY